MIEISRFYLCYLFLEKVKEVKFLKEKMLHLKEKMYLASKKLQYKLLPSKKFPFVFFRF